MKIFIVANYNSSSGGISSQVTQLRNNLVNDGHVVEIFSLKTSWLRRLTCYNELRARIRKADVVHVHCCSKIGFSFPSIIKNTTKSSCPTTIYIIRRFIIQ